MLPTFLICGAGKSGTTALWSALKAHPQLCMARVKEPRFLTRQLGREHGGPEDAPYKSGRFERGWAWYESLFENCVGAGAAGEASTTYLHAPDAAALIREHLPDLKLIFMLRNPVDRTYSHYWQEKKQGAALPPFERLMDENAPHFRRYLRVSRYKKQLERYFGLFPGKQLLILLYDHFKQNPAGVVRRVVSFLGLNPEVEFSDLAGAKNPAAMPRLAFIQRLLTRTYGLKLAENLTPRLKRRLSRLREALVNLNRRVGPYPPLDEKRRAYLIKELEEDIVFVEEVLCLSLESWRAGKGQVS